MLDNRPLTNQPPAEPEDEQVLPPFTGHERPAERGSFGSTLREIIETILFILLIFFAVRSLIQNFRIDGSSMEPNLHHDQYIIVNKIVFFHFDSNTPLRLLPGNRNTLPQHIVYPLRMPHRGDVVVIEAPSSDFDPGAKDYIKRVIGLPGETILIREGKVYINNALLDEPYLAPGQRTDCGTGQLCKPYKVPPGTVVVFGDNRSNSQDSRMWGAEPGLPLDHVIGLAWISYWPRSDWGIIPDPTYASVQP
jgi:signal peptidase I